jgi:hypothetical protein
VDPNEIIKLLRRQPFEPFALRLLDGRVFEVHHPELLVVGKRDVFLFLSSNGADQPIEDWVIISPVAIASLHPVHRS